ncbi:hypothetical protein MHH70_13890 [Metasolibacillus sp. FSL H7-0170]|uniref:hypothetical protein n=1 Tax=Metasolibacillus TaxID=2703677 RepID=UPI000D35E53C|nr:hypothetical protein [Metasolibacillus fluoroglycofenilyticus]
MNILIRIGMFFSLLLVLIGCDSVNLSKATNYEEAPPALKLTIEEIEITTHRGTYAWSYFDKSTGQQVTVQADHAPPTEMVNIEQGTKVNLSQPIKLDFEIEPTQYEIRLWNSSNIIKTYNSFGEIKEKGKYIIEIAGTWGDNIATYVVALEIE